MGRRKPKIRYFDDLEIQDMAFGGEGIAKLATDKGDFVVFVKNALPGQVVDAKIIKYKKSFAKCKLVRVKKASPEEVDMPYQSIPGAPFMRLPIEKQEAYKQTSTLEMYKRIAKVENIEDIFETYISSPESVHYRNKMEYSFSTLISELKTEQETEGFALGFKRRGQWWAVENLDKDSGLFDQQLEDNLHKIRAFCEGTGLPPWNPRKSEGFFRFLVVRKSFVNDELLLNLVTTSQDLEQFDKQAFVGLLQEILGDRLAGLWHTINDDIGDAAKQPAEQSKLLYGKGKIVERILGLDFEISMQSFFQTNPRCAELLYSKVIDYVKLSMQDGAEDQVVMDLFCGTGTIAQLLAQNPQIGSVIGVDIVPEAIVDAKENAKRNKIDDIKFYAADVRKFLKEYPQYIGKINTIVLDPPRAGIAPKALLRVIELGASAIVYVSCNPSTQARDTLTLREHGYELQNFCLVDQFPHTAHIESIAFFKKK
ncbi:MAG: 23S rRNA (uracil(1939)-C(5))-methyltransferase RlmD [Aureispira sp.]|nr:23S rRNA (uracil(1939)-C(5))-methyltransferase RlmD [Aureispira sp.]